MRALRFSNGGEIFEVLVEERRAVLMSRVESDFFRAQKMTMFDRQLIPDKLRPVEVLASLRTSTATYQVPS